MKDNEIKDIVAALIAAMKTHTEAMNRLTDEIKSTTERMAALNVGTNGKGSLLVSVKQ